jgi:DHA1 family tetracycline resistance protein-like MFS transporter
MGFMGYSLMITLFTPMLMQAQGPFLSSTSLLSERVFILGILLALYPLGQFIGSPVLGALSDQFGRRPILLFSLAITFICYILLSIALTTQSLSLLMGASLVAGFAEGNVTLAQSAIADVVEKKNRSRFFGYIYLSASSAYIVGPLLGKLADPQLIPWFHEALPFWIVTTLLLFNLIWVAAIFRETRSVTRHAPVNYLAVFLNMGMLFTYRRIRLIFLINFLLYFAIFGFFRCYPMYIVDTLHIGVSKLSEYIAWVAIPIIFANLWLTGFLSHRTSAVRLTLFSGLLTALFLLTIPLFPSADALWITLFLTSLALAICLPSCATMLSTSVSAKEQGSVMGNNQSLQVLAEASSAFIGGAIASIMVSLSLITLAIVALAGVALLFFNRQHFATTT